MHKISIEYTPSPSDNKIVSDGAFFSHQHIIGKPDTPFSIFLKNDEGDIAVGLQANLDTESVYIDILWVTENLRRQGYGRKLLAAAEQEAINHGCIFSILDTWDFQSEGFYLKRGYHRLGEIKDYWLGHSRIFLRKSLR